MQFRICDSNADKFKLYDESARKSLAELYHEPETYGPASGSENPYKNLDDVSMRLF